ncbi:MAG: spermine synthase [Verrucomicrobiota bacterium]
MKPRRKLAETQTPDGGLLALYSHDDSFAINYKGQELMHSKMNASERLLGELGTQNLPKDQPTRILIGGIGLGFTLQRVLETTGSQTQIEQVELLPAVIDWNRTHLAELNQNALEDPRVQTITIDIVPHIRNATPKTYDSILLDVDNGPTAMVAASNNSLYSKFGLHAIWKALKPGGQAIIWSAGPDHKFETRLKKAGFQHKAIPAKTHASAKRHAYLLYQAVKLSS